MHINRRSLMGGAAVLAGAAAALPMAAKAKPFAPSAGPRSRLLYVNDLSGDIDGLFATVHALLSPTSELRGIVGTRAMMANESAELAAANAREMLALMGMAGKVPVFAGSEQRLGKDKTAKRAPGVQAIIDEAMRTDTDLPLYVGVGGGLTEVASAILIEPKVAERITLVWIGGGSWPDGIKNEYNFNLDPDAARFLFNETQVPIWTIPQAVYATCVISATELQAWVAPHGKIGAWLYQKVVDYPQAMARNLPPSMKMKLNLGETWTLGDSPLVVLTSLGDWVPNFDGKRLTYDRTGAGHFDEVTCPLLNTDGTFTARTEGRKVRIYKDIDTRLMFGDFFAKLALHFPAK